ncbi:MAG: hypothetical protein ACLRO4_04055 [Lachnospiraceae bacterium]
MIQQETKQREIRKFMIMLSVVNLALFAVTCRGMVRSYNTTMLALSYEYGFTSRSLLGTLYHLLDAVLPLDLIDYRAVVATAYVATILFVLFVEYFLYRCLRCCEGEMVKYGEYLALILSLCLVSTFSFPYNFFRVDIFMILVSLLGVLCLVKERAQWLVVPLSALGVMFHQGYVFMYFNLILVLLFYRALSWWKEDRRKARRYGLLFALSFLVGSVLFLWFEFFSRSNGAAFFDTIKSEAEKLSYDGIYHSTLLYHEVLGIDLASTEEEFSRVNAVQILMCGIVCLPMLVFAVRFFAGLIKKAKGASEKWKYLAVALGAATILPDFLLKIDYGRWMAAVVVYYVGIVLALLAMKDPIMETQVRESGERLIQRPGIALWIMVVILLLPFLDVNIDPFFRHLGSIVNKNFLHWYEPMR